MKNLNAAHAMWFKSVSGAILGFLFKTFFVIVCLYFHMHKVELQTIVISLLNYSFLESGKLVSGFIYLNIILLSEWSCYGFCCKAQRDKNPIKEKRAGCWIVFLTLSPMAPDFLLSVSCFFYDVSQLPPCYHILCLCLFLCWNKRCVKSQKMCFCASISWAWKAYNR